MLPWIRLSEVLQQRLSPLLQLHLRHASLPRRFHVLGLGNHEAAVRSPTGPAVTHLSIRQRCYLQRFARAIFVGKAENANTTPKHVLANALRQGAEGLARLAARAQLSDGRCLKGSRTARCVFIQTEGHGPLILGGRSLEAAAGIRIRMRHLDAVEANRRWLIALQVIANLEEALGRIQLERRQCLKSTVIEPNAQHVVLVSDFVAELLAKWNHADWEEFLVSSGTGSGYSDCKQGFSLSVSRNRQTWLQRDHEGL